MQESLDCVKATSLMRLDGAKLAGAAVGGTSGLLLLPEVGGAVSAGAPAFESDLPKHDKAGTVESLLTPEARVAATAGESGVRFLSLHVPLCVTGHLLHVHSADGDESCAVGVASVSAASGVAALPAGRSLTYARVPANACGEVASVSNSGRSDTGNSLRVQRSSSYNLQGVVAPNSRRKVRQSCTVGSWSAEQTVDMSPARLLEHIDGLPAQCMPSDRFLGNVWQRALGVILVRVLVQAVGGGVSGLAAACLEIPCSLVMPPGRHQFATAISGLGAGMWYWEIGSWGAKG